MARSKKEALSQKVVNVATTGMPSPVRKFLGNRIIALLIVLMLPVLYATGVVSIEWQNGRPSLSFDRQKAAEVKKKTAEKIHELRDEERRDQGGLLSVLPHGEQQPKFAVELKQDEQFGDKVAERVEEVRDHFGEAREQRFSLTPATGGDETRGGQAARPLPRLKQLFDKRR